MSDSTENNRFEAEKEGKVPLKYIHMSTKRSTKVDATQAVEEYIGKQDWRITANANTGYSHAGLINNLAGKLIANYWLDEVYSKEEGDAHRNGDYHIHDLDSLAPYCCGHDFQKILDEGFNGVVGRVGSKPPKHLREALYQLANYFGILQAEWAGAQAVSSFDTYLAPYVFFDMEVNGVSYDDIKKAMRNFVFNLNVPSRWGQCVPDTYKCLRGDGKWVRYNELKEGDEIYVVDKTTGALKKDKLTHINIFESPDTLHQYYDKDTGFTFFVTDQHRVIHRDSSGDFVITESNKLLNQHASVAIPISRWTPIKPEEYCSNESPLSDDIIELIALIISTSETDDNKIRFQIGNQNNADLYLENRLEDLLDNLNIGYIRQNHPVISGVTIYDLNTKGYKAIPDTIKEALKHPEVFINSLSIRQANIIIDTWSLVSGNFNGQSWTLKESKFAFGGLLPLIILKSGKAVKCPVGKDETVIYKRGTRTCTIMEVDTPCEKVWCPTTNTGTFVCMSDSGYVFFTGNSPFTNVTIDWTVPNLMKDLAPTRGGKNYYQSIIDEWKERNKNTDNILKAIRKRFEEVDKDTYNLLKDDDDAIMLSFTYRFLQKDMRVIDRAFYEVLNEGDVLGQPFTFPIPTINITEDFDWDGENTDLLFENTAKYGSSYFQNFIGSQYMIDENGNKVRDPNAYSPNDVRSMCPLTIDTLVPTNNGIKRIMDLDEHLDRVFLHGAWYPFHKIIDIPPQQCYMIRLNGYLPNGEQISFKAGAYHLQPVYNPETRSYIKKYVSTLTEADFIPVEGVFDAQTYQYIVGNGNYFIAGDDSLQYIQVESITPIPYQPLMCLEVGNNEHCFTLACGVVTSNCRLQLDKRQLRRRGGGALFGSDANTGCYDSETEVLTKDGWKYFKDVTLDDELYTLTSDRKIEVHKPIETFAYDYEGDMIEFKTKTLDLLVTPNHNMPLFHNDSKQIYWKKAENCNHHFNLPIYGEWETKEKPEFFILKAAEKNRNGKSYSDIKIPYKTWMAFLGLFISEGAARCTKGGAISAHRYEIIITQKKQYNISIIDDIMNGMPFTVHRKVDQEGTVQWSIGNKSLWEELYPLGCSYKKYLPEYVFSLPKEYLQNLFDMLLLGDGHIRKGSKIDVTYYTSSLRLANDVQHLCLLLGHATWLDEDTRHRNKPLTIRGRIIEKKRPMYEVNVHYSYNRNFKGGYKKVPYKGKVYCVEVPNHIVCVRRNGHVVWCGNSVGVVTINCPRLGYLYKGDKEGMYKRLDELCELAKSTLEKKRKFVTDLLQRGLYPYTRRYIGSYNTYFSTIGVIGVNEMIRNFTNDEHDITDKFGQDFATELLEHIRALLVVYQEETGNLYNIEGVPGEGTTRRFSHIDIKKYPDIIQAGFSDSIPYYTNSTQLPVEFTADVFTALDLQDKLQKLYTGGITFHVYTRERIKSVESCKRLVKTIMSNYRLPYISITPSFSTCPIHGRIEGEHEYCPKCDQEIIMKHLSEVDLNEG